MEKKIILGIQVDKSNASGVDLQAIFSKYGGLIKTRLGLNEVESGYASPKGIVLLELEGDDNECHRLENELLQVDALNLQKMIF